MFRFPVKALPRENVMIGVTETAAHFRMSEKRIRIMATGQKRSNAIPRHRSSRRACPGGNRHQGPRKRCNLKWPDVRDPAGTSRTSLTEDKSWNYIAGRRNGAALRRWLVWRRSGCSPPSVAAIMPRATGMSEVCRVINPRKRTASPGNGGKSISVMAAMKKNPKVHQNDCNAQ